MSTTTYRHKMLPFLKSRLSDIPKSLGRRPEKRRIGVMLANLPQELIEHIAHYLDEASLSALRLVNRIFNTKIFGSWVKCLHTIRTDIGARSLERILAIGQLASLRDHVHCLLIYGTAHWGGLYGKGLEWSRDSTGKLLLTMPNDEFRLLQACLCDQLGNCRSFWFQGWGDIEHRPKSGFLTLSEVVILFLNIIAETGLAIQSFSLDTTYWLNASDFEPYFVLSSQPLFNQGWLSLRRLDIGEKVHHSNVTRIRDMIQRAPNVRRLSLNIDDDFTSTISENVLGLRLSFLEDVFLADIQLTAEVLLAFLRPSQDSLRRLTLKRTRLQDGGQDDNGRCKDWKYLFQSLRTGFPRLQYFSLDNPHGPFPPRARPGLEKVRVNFPTLIDHDGRSREARLSEELPDEKFRLELKIRVAPPACLNPVPCMSSIVYEGRYMAQALERLEETIEYI